ncbi:MAG: hypothetical protein KIT43_02980 [Bauldia sp.]|nr:hypothetical protein [Bauldia sp.]MCW5719352.1 hypothetical protein [Bauldia sp.]
MGQSLDDFETDLEGLIGRPTSLRPFVCDGSPLECEAFIVGFNPATTMSRGFWDFWKGGYGFERERWFSAYKAERAARPLAPGKTRRNPISNTRRVIDWIMEAAAPVRFLETNVHSLPSDDIKSLAYEDRQTAAFDFLLSRLRPKAILAHGNDAAAWMKHVAPPEAHVVAVSHFSRGWSRDAARRVGAEVAAAVNRRPYPDVAPSLPQPGESRGPR